MNVKQMGWDQQFEDQFLVMKSSGYRAGRIVQAQSGKYFVLGESGLKKGALAGRFRHSIVRRNQYPCVGDWVVYSSRNDSEDAFIERVLSRKNSFVRKLPISGGRKLKNGSISGGIIEEQVICANIDTVFIVTGLDQNFDIHRIERYITLVFTSGSDPVLLLNKADICNDVGSYKKQVEAIAQGIPVYAISAHDGTGMDALQSYLHPGKTVVFLGSSGVGKSTITNWLLGEEKQATNDTSVITGKGKHTTVKTELLFHSTGAMIIDTPGLRELQLWGSVDSLNESYRDIHDLSLQCRFRNCTHDSEPGCAVIRAILDGRLTENRLNSYKKQLRELTRLQDQKMEYDKSMSKKDKIRIRQKSTKSGLRRFQRW